MVKLNESVGVSGWDPEFFVKAVGHNIPGLWKMYQKSLAHLDPENDIGEAPEFPPLDQVFFENQLTVCNLDSTNIEFENTCPEHPGGIVFMEMITDPVKLTRFLSQKVIATLYGSPPRHRPQYIDSITIILRDMPGVAHVCGSRRKKQMHVSANHVQSICKRGSSFLMNEILGIFAHELTHVWQYSEQIAVPEAEDAGDSLRAPGGLTEGIADYVRLICGYAPLHWKRKRSGAWDQGYDATAYFLQWIEGTYCPDLVKKINFSIGKSGWNKDCFRVLTGKEVDTLWEMYCASV